MRVDVKKFLFVGTEDEKESFFKKAQEVGLVHFIDPHARPRQELPADVQQITAAIKVLRHLPPVEQEENFDVVRPDEVVTTILDLHHENERLLERLRVLRLEMARVEIYGDFSMEDIAYIEREGNCKIQFFCARPTLFQDEPAPDELIFIAYEHGLNYYVAINPSPVAYDKMIEIKIDYPLGELQQQYKAIEQQQNKAEHRLKEYAKYNDLLHHFLVTKLNKYNLYTVQTYVQEAMDGTLFAVEGWVPENKVDRLQGLTDRMHVYAEEIAIEPTDMIPTYLENKGVKRIGEDLVHIYDTPSASDKDPSMWVLGSFALFFAFIIGDAGYGLVYLAIALFLRYKFPHAKGLGKRVLDLFTILSIGCIVWGILTTSFFGMQISLDNPIRKLSLIQWLAQKKAEYHIAAGDAEYQNWVDMYPQLKDIRDPYLFATHEVKGEIPILSSFSNSIMFELALFIGVVHVILSLLRYAGRNVQGLGWVVFLIGAYLYFAYYLDVPSLLNYVGGISLETGGTVGLQLMIGGIIFAWGVSIYRNGFTGVFEIMNLIQVFADILSYLRLYALGLAGAIVSGTINEISTGLPFIIGMLLTLVAHFVNIVLGTMSGIIHGLRLNFIEWYHYSFEGGGKQFQPLKLIKKE